MQNCVGQIHENLAGSRAISSLLSVKVMQLFSSIYFQIRGILASMHEQKTTRLPVLLSKMAGTNN
jgi:hypothetical protein